jgi:hypothetical protein
MPHHRVEEEEPALFPATHRWANSALATEQEIECRVAEIGRVIRDSEPERSAELKDYAEMLPVHISPMSGGARETMIIKSHDDVAARVMSLTGGKGTSE